MFCHEARRKCHVPPALSPSQACEGGPAPDRDPGAAAGGPLLSRQDPARLPGRRPSPDLSRERERRFRVSVCIPHAVPPSHSAPLRSIRPSAGPASGTLFRAYRVRARAGVRAGAVCAPDCACVRETPKSGRTSPVRSVRIFFAPARSSPADAASTAPY